MLNLNSVVLLQIKWNARHDANILLQNHHVVLTGTQFSWVDTRNYMKKKRKPCQEQSGLAGDKV